MARGAQTEVDLVVTPTALFSLCNVMLFHKNVQM
jgi:hypothetical protein